MADKDLYSNIRADGAELWTCVHTGEFDYLLSRGGSDDPIDNRLSPKLFLFEASGLKTVADIEKDDWCPGNRQDLVDRRLKFHIWPPIRRI